MRRPTVSTNQNPAIVCDMATAPDTPGERLAEYRDLFGNYLIARERTATGIRFRLRAQPGVAVHVRDLAGREKACCAFFDFTITETGDEVIWDATVVDDPIAKQILDEYYQLPEIATESPDVLYARFADKGLNIVLDDHGALRPRG
jgi:hypothetical protein